MYPSQLSLHHISVAFTGHTVLDDVSVSISPGETVGIIGDNGAGKSTLLSLMAGHVEPDSGEVTVAADGGIGYLPQTPRHDGGATVQDAADQALAGIRDLQSAIAAAEASLAGLGGAELDPAMEAYAAVVQEFEAREGYAADARLEAALHGLGLPHLDRGRPLDTLSGGELTRLALAGTLAANPGLLLLDEPTNDLDDDAVAWLEGRLASHRGTVVAVTHDRVFLQRLTDTILEIDAGTLTRYGNGYACYLAGKATERRRRLLEYETWRAELERNQRLVARNSARLAAIPRKLEFAVFAHGAFRSRGRGHGAMGRMRMAKARIERLGANPVAAPPEPLLFTPDLGAGAPDTGTPHPEDDGGACVAELAGVRVGSRLDIAGLRIGSGDRLLVTGPNGAGKSTLMDVLAGEVRPDEGQVAVMPAVGYLRQRQTVWPDRMLLVQAFAQGRPGTAEEHIARLLALGLFSVPELRLRIGELSYGQRRRIELARLVTEPVDLLLLDEPTNHLAPALIEELEDALDGYGGAVVIVTHDRGMRSRFAGRRAHMEGGRLVEGPVGGPVRTSVTSRR